jgi:hypothetical protein
MLSATIIITCDVTGCKGRAEHSVNVEHPNTDSMPTLDSWSTPFRGWRIGSYDTKDVPTLCPRHDADRRKREEQDNAAIELVEAPRPE